MQVAPEKRASAPPSGNEHRLQWRPG